MEIRIVQPEKCGEEEVQAFYELIRMGEQVETEGLLKRIKSCRLLAYATEDKK